MPASTVAGSLDLTVTIAGSNLDPRHAGSHQTNTVVVWSANGTDTMLPTTVISSAQLTAVVPAALLAKAAAARLFVQKWYFADDTPFATSNTSVSLSAPPLRLPLQHVRRGDPPEPNAIVRCTGFSIWADSTGLLGRSKQINIHTRYKIRYMPEKIEKVIVWKKAASQGRSIRSSGRLVGTRTPDLHRVKVS